jgi:hypothetical protein
LWRTPMTTSLPIAPIAAGADYVITEDGHFDVLAASGHRPQAISPMEFMRRFCREAFSLATPLLHRGKLAVRRRVNPPTPHCYAACSASG